jgi:hypothetical protein
LQQFIRLLHDLLFRRFAIGHAIWPLPPDPARASKACATTANHRIDQNPLGGGGAC